MSCNDDDRSRLIWKYEDTDEWRSAQPGKPAAQAALAHRCTGVSPLMAWVTPFFVFLAVVSVIFVQA